jgi:tape measure domain-containing protein
MVVREFVNLIGFKVNETQLKKVESRVKNVTRKLGDIGTKMSAFVTLPIFAINVGIAKTLSQFEQLDVAFETIVGGAQKAQEVLSELYQLAATTPFEVLDITNTAKQLIAMGIEVDNVKDTLIDLGNVASGLSVPISRLALNFGQVKTQGKLTGRELRDFAIAGVPLAENLAKQLGVTKAEISKMVSAGAIGFTEVAKAFRFMARQGKFADLMIKQSKTLGGLWSNFKDIIALTVRSMSNELLPILKKVVEALIRIVRAFEKLNPMVKKNIVIFTALLTVIGPLSLALSVLGKILLFLNLKLLLIAAPIIAMVGLIGLLTNDIIGFVKGNRSLIGTILPPWDKLKDKFSAFFERTKFLFKEFLAGVSRIRKAIDLIVTGVKFGFDDLVSIGESELAKGFEDIVTSIFNMVINVLTNLIPKIAVLFAKATPVFFKIGLAIGQGILQGMLSTLQKGVFSLFDMLFGRAKGEALALGQGLIDFEVGVFDKLKSLVGLGGGGGSATNNNINTTVNLEVPAGSTTEQAKFIQDTAEKTFGNVARRLYLAGGGVAE